MLVLLIGLTVLVERLSKLLTIRYHQNVWLVNLFVPIEAIIYLCFFYLESAHASIRRFYRCLMAALPLALLITYAIQPHILIFNEFGYIAGLFLLLLAAAAFFIEHMLGRTEEAFSRQPAFWLAAGVIPFCCIQIVLLSLFAFFVQSSLWYFHICNIVSNAFLYAGVTGCFLTARKITAL